jgi:adenylate kinase family enzyme
MAATSSAPSQLPQIFCFLGGPGSGKGTNCEWLVRDFGFVHLSAGDLLRAEAKKDTPRAKEVGAILLRSEIVPAEITIALLMDAIVAVAGGSCPGVLLDGFPRSLQQAEQFEKVIGPPTAILYLHCTKDIMVRRVLRRAAEGSGRFDDTEEALTRRFAVEEQKCQPVVDMYRDAGRLVVLDATRDLETVYDGLRQDMIARFGCTHLARPTQQQHVAVDNA